MATYDPMSMPSLEPRACQILGYMSPPRRSAKTKVPLVFRWDWPSTYIPPNFSRPLAEVQPAESPLADFPSTGRSPARRISTCRFPVHWPKSSPSRVPDRSRSAAEVFQAFESHNLEIPTFHFQPVQCSHSSGSFHRFFSF